MPRARAGPVKGFFWTGRRSRAVRLSSFASRILRAMMVSQEVSPIRVWESVEACASMWTQNAGDQGLRAKVVEAHGRPWKPKKPYRGIGPALTDLLGGQVQVMFDAMSGSIEHIRAGRLRALAVTTVTHSEMLPDLPTVGEFLPGFEVSQWYGVGVSKNAPAEIIGKLNKEINAGLADPKLKARLADLGGTVLVGSPADFGKLVADETEKWGKVVRAANIKAD
jgi:hypothetical protein